MRRLGLFAGIILALGLAMPVAAAGGTHTQTSTQTFHGTSTTTDINQCNGDTVDITADGNSVQHVTWFPASDEVWATFTNTVSFTAVDEGTGVVYTGRATFWGNFNLNRQSSNQTFTETLRATGSDGSTLYFRDVMHETMLPDGSVSVAFDKPALSCG